MEIHVHTSILIYIWETLARLETTAALLAITVHTRDSCIREGGIPVLKFPLIKILRCCIWVSNVQHHFCKAQPFYFSLIHLTKNKQQTRAFARVSLPPSPLRINPVWVPAYYLILLYYCFSFLKNYKVYKQKSKNCNKKSYN